MYPDLSHDEIARFNFLAHMNRHLSTKVKTVVAVSCEPKTFARDAAILIAGGYRLEKVTPVDQFAWSAHVELVGVFRR